MGLPTGVEVKTAEPAIKVEEAVVPTTVEEVKPEVTPTETTNATTETANADRTDAAEVSVSASGGLSLYCPAEHSLSLILFPSQSVCSPAGTNSDEARQEPRYGAE